MDPNATPPAFADLTATLAAAVIKARNAAGLFRGAAFDELAAALDALYAGFDARLAALEAKVNPPATPPANPAS